MHPSAPAVIGFGTESNDCWFLGRAGMWLRMSSLLPGPLGCGTRNNKDKRNWILDHLGSIEYQTIACTTVEEAKDCERKLRENRNDYLVPT